jgi:kelch-like protein 20
VAHGAGAGSAPNRVARGGHAARSIVRASVERWHLRQPVSREVVLPDGARLAIVGGLDGNGDTTARVDLLDPANGAIVATRPLARAAHDAAGAIVAGRAMVFGGGSATSQSWIQQQAATGRWQVVGALPAARSDLDAVSVSGSAYVLGGYDGTHLDPSVLRVSTGTSVEVVGRLPVPVRYPAVAAVGDTLWIVGGLSRAGPTAVVQRFDVTSGQVSVAARLPVRLDGATAVALGGQVYVCGGVVAGSSTAQIYRIDPATGHVSRAGRLPARVSYAGAAVLHNAAFIVGGETPAASARVIRLRLVPAAGSKRRPR